MAQTTMMKKNKILIDQFKCHIITMAYYELLTEETSTVCNKYYALHY